MEWRTKIFGVMIESNLVEGKQDITKGKLNLKKGVSVTDGCVGIKETERMLLNAHKHLLKMVRTIKGSNLISH